jgi:hypothetical protein
VKVDKVDLKIIFDLLKEVREDQKQQGQELAKQGAHIENMAADVCELKASVSKNTEDIAHHIKRTDLLQELHQENQAKIEKSEARLDKLEEPVKAKEWIKQHIITISAIVTAVASAVAFLVEKFG